MVYLPIPCHSTTGVGVGADSMATANKSKSKIIFFFLQRIIFGLENFLIILDNVIIYEFIIINYVLK
jgi:hypothetical protein